MTLFITVMNFILMFHFSSSDKYFILTRQNLQDMVLVEGNDTWDFNWEMYNQLCTFANEAVIINAVFNDNPKVNFPKLTIMTYIKEVTEQITLDNGIKFNTWVCNWNNQTVYIAPIKDYNHYFMFGFEEKKYTIPRFPILVAVLVKYIDIGEVTNIIGAGHFNRIEESFEFSMHELCASLLYHFENDELHNHYTLTVTYYQELINQIHIPYTVCGATNNETSTYVNYYIRKLTDRVTNIIPAGHNAFVIRHADESAIYYRLNESDSSNDDYEILMRPM